MKLHVFVCLAGLLTTAQAQNIYKSVDEQGNVSYSSSVPDQKENVEILTPPPEPTAEAVEAARQQQEDLEQSIKESAERLEKEEQSIQQSQSETNVNTVAEPYLPGQVVPTRRRLGTNNLPANRARVPIR